MPARNRRLQDSSILAHNTPFFHPINIARFEENRRVARFEGLYRTARATSVFAPPYALQSEICVGFTRAELGTRFLEGNSTYPYPARNLNAL